MPGRDVLDAVIACWNTYILWLYFDNRLLAVGNTTGVERELWRFLTNFKEAVTQERLVDESLAENILTNYSTIL